jgi:hypothetical protein
VEPRAVYLDVNDIAAHRPQSLGLSKYQTLYPCQPILEYSSRPFNPHKARVPPKYNLSYSTKLLHKNIATRGCPTCDRDLFLSKASFARVYRFSYEIYQPTPIIPRSFEAAQTNLAEKQNTQPTLKPPPIFTPWLFPHL